MAASLLEIADLRPVILETKKVENELTRSLFSASVRVLSVWWACNSSLTVRQSLAAGCPFNSPNFNSPNSNYRVRVKDRDRVRRIEIRRIEKEPAADSLSHSSNLF